jgi:hypothetical protein
LVITWSIAANMDLKIIEANGWTKFLKINHAITCVGSSASNDIQLPASEIAPIQLQIFYSPDLPSTCRVVNLGAELLLLRGGSDSPLAPYQSLDIFDGDEVDVFGYRLAFQLPLATGGVQKSQQIEASLTMPEPVLRSGSVLVGNLHIKNIGDRPGVQFQVALSGFPDDCYQIDPVPLMYPGAEEDVQVRFFHRTISPQAGLHDLVLAVSAPADYGSEELVIRQGLYVAPVLKHELLILDSYAAALPAESTVVEHSSLSPVFSTAGGITNRMNSEAIPQRTQPSGAAALQTGVPAAGNSAALSGEPSVLEPAPQRPQPAAASTLQMENPSTGSQAPYGAKVKVVRSQTSEFWDE